MFQTHSNHKKKAKNPARTTFVVVFGIFFLGSFEFLGSLLLAIIAYGIARLIMHFRHKRQERLQPSARPKPMADQLVQAKAKDQSPKKRPMIDHAQASSKPPLTKAVATPAVQTHQTAAGVQQTVVPKKAPQTVGRTKPPTKKRVPVTEIVATVFIKQGESVYRGRKEIALMTNDQKGNRVFYNIHEDHPDYAKALRILRQQNYDNRVKIRVRGRQVVALSEL